MVLKRQNAFRLCSQCSSLIKFVRGWHLLQQRALHYEKNSKLLITFVNIDSVPSSLSLSLLSLSLSQFPHVLSQFVSSRLGSVPKEQKILRPRPQCRVQEMEAMCGKQITNPQSYTRAHTDRHTLSRCPSICSIDQVHNSFSANTHVFDC